MQEFGEKGLQEVVLGPDQTFELEITTVQL
jgi:hypothetical protein